MASKILVIDDEQVVGEGLRKTFKDEGYEIETAYSGQEGLRKARRETFDLMIVELKMPDISGLDVIKRYMVNIQIDIEVIALLLLFSIHAIF